MNRCLNVVIAFLLTAAVPGCNDEDERPYLRVIDMEWKGHGSHDLFATYRINFGPVLLPLFNPSRTPIAPSCKWTFGDGSESNEFTATHTYAEPGTYAVSLTINSGEKKYFDSTITIHPTPILAGEEGVAENGKFLFQNEIGNYQILYSQPDGSKLLEISTDKKILNRKTLSLEANADVSSIKISNNGNLVGLDDKFWEIDMGGNVLHNFSVNPPNLITPSLMEYNNGFYFVREENDAQVVFVDSKRNVKTTVVPGTAKAGYQITNGEFEPPDNVRLSYRDSEGRSIFWKGKVTGETIFEMGDWTHAVNRSFKLPDGYLYILRSDDPFYHTYSYAYAIANQQGEVTGAMPSPYFSLDGSYDIPMEKSSIEVFNIGGFTYVFYGKMEGFKIDSKGNTIWKKRFTFPNDKLSSVIINNEQNFVLLGTHDHHIDDLITTDEPTDLIIIEVDQDGNIID